MDRINTDIPEDFNDKFALERVLFCAHPIVLTQPASRKWPYAMPPLWDAFAQYYKGRTFYYSPVDKEELILDYHLN